MHWVACMSTHNGLDSFRAFVRAPPCGLMSFDRCERCIIMSFSVTGQWITPVQQCKQKRNGFEIESLAACIDAAHPLSSMAIGAHLGSIILFQKIESLWFTIYSYFDTIHIWSSHRSIACWNIPKVRVAEAVCCFKWTGQLWRFNEANGERHTFVIKRIGCLADVWERSKLADCLERTGDVAWKRYFRAMLSRDRIRVPRNASDFNIILTRNYISVLHRTSEVANEQFRELAYARERIIHGRILGAASNLSMNKSLC